MTPPAVLTRWQLPAVTSGVTRAECRDHAQTEAKPCMSHWQRGFCTFLPEYPRRQQIWALSVLQSTQQARCSWPAAVLRAGRDTGTRLPVCWCKNLELWTSESYCSEIQERQEGQKGLPAVALDLVSGSQLPVWPWQSAGASRRQAPVLLLDPSKDTELAAGRGGEAKLQLSPPSPWAVLQYLC